MDRNAAEKLVAIMDTAWPQSQMLDDTGQLTMRGEMFARDLEPYWPNDGAAAIEALRHEVTWHGGPSPADLQAALRDARSHRAAGDTPALPAELDLQGPAVEMPEDARAAIAAFHERTGWTPSPSALAGEERIEAARKRVAQQIIDGPAPEEPFTTFEHQVRTTSCGAAWGTPAVQGTDGIWRCPSCNSPTSEGCVGSTEKASA